MLYFKRVWVFYFCQNSGNAARNGFLSLLDQCGLHLRSTFGFGGLRRREGAKENELLLALSFPPFHVIIFGTSGDCQREVTRVERGHDWVPWSFMFPTTPPESRFSNGKPCPWGSRLPRFAHRNLCSCCLGRTGCEPGVRNSEREHPAHAPRPVRFYVKKHKFKMKIFKNFKQLTVEPQPSVSL